MTLSIPPEQMAIYKREALRREERRQQAGRERREAAVAVARRAAARLKAGYGATRVTLFGSAAHGQWFGPRSDIDLAAEGIPPADFWRAWATLDSVDPAFEINLIAFEEATEELARSIACDGVDL